MVKRGWFILIIFVLLLAGTILEQIYTNNTYTEMETQITNLQTKIASAEAEQSGEMSRVLDEYWAGRERILSLFVDYRDIEQIGRQLALVIAHLDNGDFDLAKVECSMLSHIVETYHNTIGLDWHNII